MKSILKNWDKFLAEAERAGRDISYIQRVYEVVARLKIRKSVGGDREQTFTEIRGIPGVTVVNVDPAGTSRDETNYYSTLNIKFELVGNADALLYRRTVLIPGIRKIKGCEVRYVSAIKDLGER
tara:strand:- start:120 stop:491 length:372 start_codon:yes stop_codon:yes gene_type:complete